MCRMGAAWRAPMIHPGFVGSDAAGINCIYTRSLGTLNIIFLLLSRPPAPNATKVRAPASHFCSPSHAAPLLDQLHCYQLNCFRMHDVAARW